VTFSVEREGKERRLVRRQALRKEDIGGLREIFWILGAAEDKALIGTTRNCASELEEVTSRRDGPRGPSPVSSEQLQGLRRGCRGVGHSSATLQRWLSAAARKTRGLNFNGASPTSSPVSRAECFSFTCACSCSRCESVGPSFIILGTAMATASELCT
jgi:hypothetical protein